MNQSSTPKGLVKLKRVLLPASFWALAGYALLYPFLNPPEVELELSPTYSKAAPVPNFNQYTNVVEKKQAFFSYLLPEVQRQNSLVMQERLFVLGIDKKIQANQTITQTNFDTLRKLAKKYNLDEEAPLIELVTELIRRVDIIPPELVLVQAANESAWGTSRFAQEGYNFFGLWCFKKGCGFVPSRRNEGSEHEVAKFKNLAHAVNTYLRNLNRHYAYEELRSIRASLRDNQQTIRAEALVQGLMSYSERGQDYIDELLNMIRYNKKYMQV